MILGIIFTSLARWCRIEKQLLEYRIRHQQIVCMNRPHRRARPRKLPTAQARMSRASDDIVRSGSAVKTPMKGGSSSADLLPLREVGGFGPEEVKPQTAERAVRVHDFHRSCCRRGAMKSLRILPQNRGSCERIAKAVDVGGRATSYRQDPKNRETPRTQRAPRDCQMKPFVEGLGRPSESDIRDSRFSDAK